LRPLSTPGGPKTPLWGPAGPASYWVSRLHRRCRDICRRVGRLTLKRGGRVGSQAGTRSSLVWRLVRSPWYPGQIFADSSRWIIFGAGPIDQIYWFVQAKNITKIFPHRGTPGGAPAYFCGAALLGDPTELPGSALAPVPSCCTWGAEAAACWTRRRVLWLAELCRLRRPHARTPYPTPGLH